MNLRKNLGRVASTIVATALLASVATVPAFAAEGDPGITTNPANNQFTIQKYLEVEDKSMLPNETFNFTVRPATADELTDADKEKGVVVGVTNGVSQASGAAFTPGSALPQEADKTEDATFTVNVTAHSNKAGIYKYIVKEVTSTTDDPDFDAYEGVTYSTEVKALYVHMANTYDEETGAQTGIQLIATELVDLDENGNPVVDEGATTYTKSNKFTNVYGDDPDTPGIPEYEFHNLTIKKEITGDAANMSEEFDFSFTITGDETGEAFYYEVFKDGAQQASSNGTVVSGSPVTNIELGNGDYIVVYNLSKGDDYSITETEANTDNYETSVKTNGTETTDNNGTVSAQDMAADTEVVYTNKRTNVTPTGIVMNVAPYALLVVVAVAGCFVFLRKRNED